MNIHVVSGTGQAATLLSSFDEALSCCGVYNYNLIALSSVIPPGSKVVEQQKYQTPPNEYGQRLYVVKADMRSDQAGKVIAAGIGWYQWDDGRGVFVEHETISSTEEGATQEMDFRINHSLEDLCHARHIPFSPDKIGRRVVISHVKDQPATVLALAVYKSEPW